MVIPQKRIAELGLGITSLLSTGLSSARKGDLQAGYEGVLCKSFAHQRANLRQKKVVMQEG